MRLSPHDDFYVNAVSAGIDCLGFVMRSAEYAGNPYYGTGGTWSATLHDHDPYDRSS